MGWPPGVARSWQCMRRRDTMPTPPANPIAAEVLGRIAPQLLANAILQIRDKTPKFIRCSVPSPSRVWKRPPDFTPRLAD
eukprot:3546664-Pyramimonas_sp.AAC.1